MIDFLEIYSIHYNKPEYLQLQIDSFKKFINIDYKFIVIDNSIDESISKRIKIICENNNLEYIYSNNKVIHGPQYYGWSHIHGLNLFKDNLLKASNNYIMLIEHDIFLCNNLDSMFERISNNSICGVYQNRGHINYLHPGLLFFNKLMCDKLDEIDFLGGHVEGIHVDVGGQTHNYIKRENIKTEYIDEFVSSGLDEILKINIFYHMVDGSNWSNKSSEINTIKLNKIKNIIYE